MPNGITIVSPASGETIFLTTTSELVISTDFETAQGNTVAKANCSAPAPHDGDPFPVSGDGEAEVKIGPHGTVQTYTGVTLTARLQSTDGSTTYAQSSVNDITLIVGTVVGIPPINVVEPPAPPESAPGAPYFFVSESGIAKADWDKFVTEPGKPPGKFDPVKNTPKRNREVDLNKELVVSGTVSVHKNGYLSLTLSRKKKKTGLVACHTVQRIPINNNTGAWTWTIVKEDVEKFKKLRQAVFTLFDNQDDAVATLSIPLKLK